MISTISNRSFFAAMFALAASHAFAAELPSLGDPFSTQKKLAPYGANLKPVSCPAASDTTKPLTLGEVVISTVCHNPDSRAAYLTLLASADSYDVTLMSYLPDVTASISAGATQTFTESSKSSVSRSSSVSAETSVTLYDFGRRETTLDIAERTLVVAGLGYDSTLQGFIATSLQQYFDLLTAQDNVGISKEALALTKATLDAAETRYQLGLVPLSDALQARTSHSQAELALEQAQNTLALARASLAQLMGFAPLTPVSVSELGDATLLAVPFDKELPALIEKAKAQRVDLKAKELALHNAEDSLKNTKRRGLPTISAAAGTGFDDWDVLNNDNPRSDTIGVTVSIPLFTGFGKIFAERAERKQLEAQHLQYVQSERDVEQDVLKSWQNYTTSSKSYEISASSLGVAKQLMGMALGRYKEGLGSILDVLSAQNAYRTAQQSHLSARYNLLTTRVDLVRAVGELDLHSVEPQAAEMPPLASVIHYQDPLLSKGPHYETP